MITMKDFLEVIDYKISSGSEFLWDCYGENSYLLDCNVENHCSLGIVSDTKTQVVYEAAVHDYQRNNSYRLINPEYVNAYMEEAKSRGVDPNVAWDNIKFIDLELAEDWMDKARAIFNNEEYDDRIKLHLTFNNEKELYDLMLAAHECDMTLNEYIVKVVSRLSDK